MTDKDAVLQLCKSLKFNKVNHWPGRFEFLVKEKSICIGPHASSTHVTDFIFNNDDSILFHATFEQ